MADPAPRLGRYQGALLGLAVALYVVAGLVIQRRLNQRLPSDATIFFDAARRAFAGANPYEPFSIGTSFVYPPSSLAFFLPFAALPTRIASILWGAVGVALYGGSVLLLLRKIGGTSGGGSLGGLAMLALAAAYAPFLESASIGQSNSLVLFGLVLFLVGLEDRRWRWIGDAGLALAISIKLSPVVLLALPASRLDFPRLARVLAGLAALAACSLLFFPVRLWSDFAEVLPKLLSPYVSLLNQAPGPTVAYVLFETGGDPSWGAIAGRAFSLGVLVTWLGVVVSRRTFSQLPLALLGVVTMTLGSGLVWFHHLVYLVPALVLLPARFRNSRPFVPIATVVSLAFLQSDRLLELSFPCPPVASILGYLLLYVTTLLVATSVPESAPCP